MRSRDVSFLNNRVLGWSDLYVNLEPRLFCPFRNGSNNQFTSPIAADMLLIPDGSGGLLCAGSTMNRIYHSDQSVTVKHIVDPRQSDAGPTFSLPSTQYINQLVVGENDTAYAAGAYDGYYGARIVAFGINGGGKKWDYDPPRVTTHSRDFPRSYRRR
jgi:hypothetical protein